MARKPTTRDHLPRCWHCGKPMMHTQLVRLPIDTPVAAVLEAAAMHGFAVTAMYAGDPEKKAIIRNKCDPHKTKVRWIRRSDTRTLAEKPNLAFCRPTCRGKWTDALVRDIAHGRRKIIKTSGDASL